MKISIECPSCCEFKANLSIDNIYYSDSDDSLAMRLVMGDDWFQRIPCPKELMPEKYSLECDPMKFHFDDFRNAIEFINWIVASEERVRDGYRTMRG